MSAFVIPYTESMKIEIRDHIKQALDTADAKELEKWLRIATFRSRMPLDKYISETLMDESGNNVLHLAAAKNLVATFKFIQTFAEAPNSRQPFSVFADVLRAQNDQGNTPLHVAVLHDDLAMVKTLYAFYNGRAFDTDSNGKVQVEIYLESGRLDEEWRRPLNEFLSLKNRTGRTALDEAWNNSHTSVGSWLQETAQIQGTL